MTPGDRQELADLPCHGWVDGGARVLTPCGEVLLSERTADAIIAHGLMPLASPTGTPYGSRGSPLATRRRRSRTPGPLNRYASGRLSG
jgi:hypothetical protein